MPLVHRERPGFVVVELDAPHRCTSWAPHGGGVVTASRVVWCGVQSADLPLGVSPEGVLRGKLERAGLDDSVAMMTSRDLAHVHRADAEEAGVKATAIVTAGYGNALRVGDPTRPVSPVGTINVLVVLDRPLDDMGRLEAMSLAVEARTLAAHDANHPSIVSGERATGTGTDCVIVATPLAAPGATAATYAGKHTAVGAAVGRAAWQACHDATTTWVREKRGG